MIRSSLPNFSPGRTSVPAPRSLRITVVEGREEGWWYLPPGFALPYQLLSIQDKDKFRDLFTTLSDALSLPYSPQRCQSPFP